MIRFCDKEVYTVSFEQTNRDEILDFFLRINIDQIVCVTSRDGKFNGIITYYSIINVNCVIDSILKDYVIMNQYIWEEAKGFFARFKGGFNEHKLLPVLDKEYHLICFAYEDNDANREIRMLRELSENTLALQFTDIYPEYDVVRIYGFNELAYRFAQYLKSLNVSIQLFGEFWDLFFETDRFTQDCNYMKIYAEGIAIKKADWVENLFESVSVEFECIDKIYEINIKNGFIKDAMCVEDVIKRLEGGKTEIIILGSGREAQNAYDFLRKENIDIYCFVNDDYEERSHRLFGKEIIGNLEIRTRNKNLIFIECSGEHSAWGFGGTDYYDYIGYKRNESYYLAKDYSMMGNSALINVLKDKKVILLGELNLCIYLYDFFLTQCVSVIGYLNIDSKDTSERIPEVNPDEIDKDTVCLLAFPENFEQIDIQEMKKKKVVGYLKEYNIDNYSDYFCYTASYLEIERYKIVKYTKEALKIKKIIIGSIEYNCGNNFFRGVLDNHPAIMMLNNSWINENLYWICIRLSNIKNNNILEAFWKMCADDKIINDCIRFNHKMEQLLALSKYFTSQELFVMIHIAFAYMCRRKELDINNMIIYWEPHSIPRVVEEKFAAWLGSEEIRCDIINVVRNKIMSNGIIKAFLKDRKRRKMIYEIILGCPPIVKKKYQWSDRLIVKFEDIKCNPKKIMMEICNRWGILWSDTFLEITVNGENSGYDNGDYIVYDFDLMPVYNTNEKIFSEFDRFRMMIINGPWQKKFGYPYLEITQFSRRELQEMFLKKFRFEEMLEFESKKMELEFRISVYHLIRYYLQKVRMVEVLFINE